MRNVLALLALGLLAIAPTPATLRAQSDSRPLAFEVATIKANRSIDTSYTYGSQPGGVWRMVNVSISRLIREAYPMPSGEVVGAPEWVTSDRYDVIAKGAGNPTREQTRQMLRTLLLDRFKFAEHSEMRELPVWSLVVARSDGRPSAGLHASTLDCDAVAKARSEGRKPDGPVPANGAPACGWANPHEVGATLLFGGLPLARLGEALGQPDGRVVLDKTGLKGNYEFTLRYSGTTDPANDQPSVYTALEEQLGLKLVSDRAPLEVLVVDHVERPTED